MVMLMKRNATSLESNRTMSYSMDLHCIAETRGFDLF